MSSNLTNEILRICNKEYDFFLNKANVEGVGLGFKRIRSYKTREKVIVVFVTRKLPPSSILPKDIIPPTYKGIKTDVVELGRITARSLKDRVRPVTGGYSIGPSGVITSGSYGGLVTDGKDNFILSNNHVLALGNLLPLDTPILQPSSEDGGTAPADIIANLTRFITIKFITPQAAPPNVVDCAIAKVAGPGLVSPIITALGIPTGITIPFLDEIVQFSCRESTSGSGPIYSVGTTIRPRFQQGRQAIFTNQIGIQAPSLGGDSGSLVLSLDKKAVGLLFSGTPNFSFLNPIDVVLSELNVSLVTS